MITQGIVASSTKTNLTGIFELDREIIFNLDPKSILNLCQTGKHIFPICNNDNIFRQLIKIHYPQANPTSTPKQQFIALVNGVTTKYFILCNRYKALYITDTNGNTIFAGNTFLNEIYLYDSDIYESDFAVPFTIKGIRVDNDIYWLRIEMYYERDIVEVFLTKEAAINDFLNDNYDEIIGDLIDDFFDIDTDTEDLDNIRSVIDQYYDLKYGRNDLQEMILNSEEFKLYLINNEYPHDMHREALFDYIMKNGVFNLKPYVEDTSTVTVYQFIKVTIRNRHLKEEDIPAFY